eukprot:GHVT01069194.1.p1 GENE.GHVT01069194.1~~GHVT01069194.1.p1  ORF type:complete len:171 (+),score=45.50 GHVT01069194.1:365-877(+)
MPRKSAASGKREFLTGRLPLPSVTGPSSRRHRPPLLCPRVGRQFFLLGKAGENEYSAAVKTVASPTVGWAWPRRRRPKGWPGGRVFLIRCSFFVGAATRGGSKLGAALAASSSSSSSSRTFHLSSFCSSHPSSSCFCSSPSSSSCFCCSHSSSSCFSSSSRVSHRFRSCP